MRFYFYYLFLATRNGMKSIYLYTKMDYCLRAVDGGEGGRVGWGGGGTLTVLLLIDIVDPLLPIFCAEFFFFFF